MRLALACLLALAATTAAQAVVIEDFEDGNATEYIVVGDLAGAYQVTAQAAHDGNYGLQITGHSGAEGWIYRDDGQVHVQQGDLISIWTRTMQVGDNYSRNYLGFGATAGGCYSAVVALNTQSLLIQYNPGYGYAALAEVGYPIQTGHWYRVEIDWQVGGQIDAYLYDSDGVTLLTQVSAVDNSITNGGIAFRSFDSGYAAYFDTVEIPGPTATASTTWGGIRGLYR